MTSVDQESPSRPWWLVVVMLLTCLVPALLAITPLVLTPLDFIADDENAAYLSMGKVSWLMVQVVVGVAPFLCAGAALIGARLAGVR